MRAEDLLAALEAQKIEPLDNQDVANAMPGNTKFAALMGDTKSGDVSAQLQEQMPEPEAQDPQTAEMMASLDLSSEGLGLS